MNRLLIVDDSAPLRSIIRVYLSAEQYEIVEAADATRAMMLARVQKPQAIIADLNMPGLSGIEMFRQLRANGMTQVGFILLTGVELAEVEAKAREAGADECIHKPITREALKSAISRAIAKHAQPGGKPA